MEQENTETHMTRLSQFVGDYSQEVEYCSYNEDTVRELWNTRRLTAYAKMVNDRDQGMLWKYRWTQYNAESDLDAICDDLVRKAGGWPVSWNPHNARDIGLLTDKEVAMLGSDKPIFPLVDVLNEIVAATADSEDPDYDQCMMLIAVYKDKEQKA